MICVKTKIITQLLHVITAVSSNVIKTGFGRNIYYIKTTGKKEKENQKLQNVTPLDTTLKLGMFVE